MILNILVTDAQRSPQGGGQPAPLLGARLQKQTKTKTNKWKWKEEGNAVTEKPTRGSSGIKGASLCPAVPLLGIHLSGGGAHTYAP